MPCRSDYMEPTQRERLLRETAQLYAYVLVETGERVPERVTQAANDAYCRTDYVSHLCEQLTQMDVDTRHRVVYNAHDKTARRLADWWEEHQAADRQRLAREQTELRQQERYEQVIAKLSDEEIAVLKKQWRVG